MYLPDFNLCIGEWSLAVSAQYVSLNAQLTSVESMVFKR